MSMQPLQTGELTRGKMALIGGLVVALIGVLWMQFGTGRIGTGRIGTGSFGQETPSSAASPTPTDASTISARRRDRPRTVRRTSSPSDEQSPTERMIAAEEWPKIDLANTTIYDPFELAPKIKALQPELPDAAAPGGSKNRRSLGPLATRDRSADRQGTANATQPPSNGASELSPAERAKQLAEAKRLEEQKQQAAARQAALLAKAQKRQGEIAALVDRGVTAIIESAGERIALVGDKEIRVGDSLMGLEVIAIHPQGIELENPRDLSQSDLPEMEPGGQVQENGEKARRVQNAEE